jgi:RNA-directed DNA polymerase
MTARRHLVALSLADALLSGPSDPEGFFERAAECLGRRHRWLRPLCQRAFQRFGSSLDHRARQALANWIRQDNGYLEAWNGSRPPRVARYFIEPPRMAPRKGALTACNLPALPTPGDLAGWLGITIGELDWFADVRGMNPPDGPLCHYRYVWIRKRHGMRLVEAPKARLRAIQRRILREILDPVPIHRAAHGFRRGLSCRTFVESHVGRDVVLRMDLRNFFPDIPSPRVHALFSTLGYPDSVARCLAALCTNRVPMSFARRGASSWTEAKTLGVPHLPQGAPTSPSVANLCALHLDFRLDALSRAIGGQYTRYADDLAISGGEALRRSWPRVSSAISAIALEEGFAINHRKTRAMHRGRRQMLTGIVVNTKPNIPRVEFDRLKAILTNCARLGPRLQNRQQVKDFRAHLAGRIANVASINAARGMKLKAIFERIAWEP